jgi:hypothetical protein
MPPKKKSTNRWFADHRPSWITGGCVVVAAIITAVLKFSNASTQSSNVYGTHSGQVISPAGNQGSIYAPRVIRSRSLWAVVSSNK